jgi:hypothetical protein
MLPGFPIYTVEDIVTPTINAPKIWRRGREVEWMPAHHDYAQRLSRHGFPDNFFFARAIKANIQKILTTTKHKCRTWEPSSLPCRTHRIHLSCLDPPFQVPINKKQCKI